MNGQCSCSEIVIAMRVDSETAFNNHSKISITSHKRCHTEERKNTRHKLTRRSFRKKETDGEAWLLGDIYKRGSDEGRSILDEWWNIILFLIM
jgi:hypothetical protein